MRYLVSLVLMLFLPVRGLTDDGLYDPDPQHMWNRLHQQLQTRTDPNGNLYLQESLEPVFIPRSTFLTNGLSHQQAVARLDEFLEQNAETLIDDPVKRAILQRDLWAVFVTTADPTLPNQGQRRELQKRLAQVIRRIALSAAEIQQLPDNLARAVQSGVFPISYNAEQPQLSFLPDRLLQDDGPWVLVRSRLRSDNLAAPLHVQATRGRSAFFLLLRLSPDRHSTLDYLKRLKELPGGTEIPQIPQGTQVALVRRMMLVDRSGKIRLTPLTESLQMRVYGTLTAPDMYEFRLRRKQLFVDHVGGLHPTPLKEVNYFDLGFLGFHLRKRHDPLETPLSQMNVPGSPVVMKSCVKCHAGPGIFGFQSMFADHFDRPPLDVTEFNNQVTPIMDTNYETYAWGLLQGLWETEISR